jgi:hypothetical protein
MNIVFQFFFELFARVRAESPEFFKKLQWLSGIISGIAGTIKALIDFKIWNPLHADGFSHILGYVITGVVTIFGSSFLPVKDNSPTKNIVP